MATSIKGENVYQCDTCNRKTRVSENKQGLDVLPNCKITLGCLGKLRRVLNARDINDTPSTPPEIPGVSNWFQRRVLYTHNQPISNAEWVINHNLDNKPMIHVYGERVINGITQNVTVQPLTTRTVDPNTTILTFANPIAGVAQCISLASQNTTNPNAMEAPTPSSDSVLLSSDACEITIATLDSAVGVNVSITFLTPEGPINIDYINVDNVVSIDSPWVNTKTAIINNKVYTLRSFNLIKSPLAPTYFASGAIPNGTAFYITWINQTPIKVNDVLFLLGKSPFASVDRITDKIVDAFNADTTLTPTYYNTGRAYVNPNAIRKTYPQILVMG